MGDMVFWSDPLPPQDLAVGRLKGGEMTLHMPSWIRLHRLTVSTSQNICALRRRVTWIVTWIYLHNLKFMPPIVKTSILLMFSPWGRQEYVCCLHHSSADGLGSCSSGSSTLWLQKESIEQRHEASVQKKRHMNIHMKLALIGWPMFSRPIYGLRPDTRGLSFTMTRSGMSIVCSLEPNDGSFWTRCLAWAHQVPFRDTHTYLEVCCKDECSNSHWPGVEPWCCLYLFVHTCSSI